MNGAEDLEKNFNIVHSSMNSVIGRTVTVTVDRPLGSYHPEHKDMYYPINYSYAESIMAPDEEGLPVGSADCKAGKCRYVDCAVGSIVARCR